MVSVAEPFDLEALWQQTLSTVTPDVTSPIQREWLSATRPVGFSEDTVIIATPHSFAREWLTSRCGDRLEKAMTDAAGQPLTLMITVQPHPEPVDPLVEADKPRQPPHPTGRPGGDGPVGEPPPPPESPPAPTGTPGAPPGEAPGGPGAQPPPDGAPADPPAGRPAPEAEPVPAARNHTEATDADRGTGAPPGRSPAAETAEGDHPHPSPQPPQSPAGRNGRPRRRPRGPGVDVQHLAAERVDADQDSDRPLEAPGRPPGPTIVLPDRPAVPDSAGAQQGAAGQQGAGTTEGQLNPKYVFENFVVGASNRFARAAARAVAEAPAKSYNPLFIYGDAGLGKTHLLHAIGHYVSDWYPRLTVRYVATEQFLNHFIDAVQNGRMTDFQHTYRQADILLIDDIQFIESKDRTQEEFFHTFNALHNAEKQIVISSDRPPKQMVALEDRLRSRFEWGLITDIQPPDLETRIAILRKKSHTDSLNVSEEVLELIATRVHSNIRELEGALIRVTAFASLQQAPADSRMAERVLKDLFPDDRRQEVDCTLIMEVTADYFDVTVEEFRSKSRTRHLTTGRQIAMYLVREMTEMSLPEIGRAFERDHTTVIHAKDKIADLMQERQTIYDQVLELTSRIKAQARGPR